MHTLPAHTRAAKSSMQLQIAVVLSHAATAFIVAAFGIALSVAAAYFVKRQMEHDSRIKFQHMVAEGRGAIETRIRSYSDALLGVRALFIASDAVTRGEFRTYIESLDLKHRYPGIQVIHFAQRVSAAQIEEFKALVRADRSVDPRGYPDFTVKPAGERTEYYVVKYAEPPAGNEAVLGLDLGGDAVRLVALERTRDSGRLTASGMIALAHDPSRHPGFAMRLPVYRKGAPLVTVEQRREAFIGVVSASFVVIDLMRGVLNDQFLQTIHVRVHDAGILETARPSKEASADNLMFDSDRLLAQGSYRDSAVEHMPPGLSATVELDVGGRRWDLHFRAREEFIELSERLLPWTTLLVGTVISLLLFALVRSLANSGRRAQNLADHITEDLRKSEERLVEAQRMTEQLIESLPNPTFFKGTDGRYLGVNREWEKFFGLSRDLIIGKTVYDLYPANREFADRKHAMDQALWDKPGTQAFETSITTPRGQRHDAIYYKATFTRTDGRVAGLIGTIVDITDRKEAAERYRATFDNAPIGIMHTAIDDHRILHANSKLCEMLGYSQEEFAHMTADQFIHPAYLGSDDSTYRSAMMNGEIDTFSSERVYRRKDGSDLWVHRTVSLARDAANKPLYFIRVIENISERKRAEQRMAMEHAVTRVLADAETLAEAIPKIIQTICETLKWHCGSRWAHDKDTGLMRCIECWGVDRPEIAEFMVENSHRTVNANEKNGQGLVRRAATTGKPVWVADLSRVTGFKRAAMVAKADLHGAFCFPLLVAGEALGVMEFFHRDVREPDEMLIHAAQSIGSQIGQYIVRQQAEERVRHLAHFDELTGLPNRTMFNERLRHALSRAQRNERSLVVLFVDLDRFKNINDTLGHDAGDHVLKEVARRLRDCLRASDTVGRLGGDEFVVLLEEPPRPINAAVVAQKIVAAVSQPFLVHEQEFDITASIGISTYPNDGADFQTLMKNADIAMYRAKEQGKNTFQFYAPQFNVHSIERLTLESGLRRALERDEFLLHYQPKLHVGSGRITGVEALVRWQHPQHGLVPPAQFIQLAEETGLVVPIGEWVLKTACAQNKAWQQQGWAPVRMAVNLSPRQFANDNLLEEVTRTLEQTGLDPAYLELEITEGAVTQNPEQAIVLLNRLKALGVHLAIDDFGTGYSSLSYLKRFPLDTLKIDRSFIRDLPGDADDTAITQAIIAMAHSLRLGVVAEGVENSEQLDFLRVHQCDEIQGYFLSKPQLAEDVAALLRDNFAAETIPRAAPHVHVVPANDVGTGSAKRVA